MSYLELVKLLAYLGVKGNDVWGSIAQITELLDSSVLRNLIFIVLNLS